MKLNEIVDEQYLYEINLRQAVAAGLISAAAMSPSKSDKHSEYAPNQKTDQHNLHTHQAYSESLAAGIARRYKIALHDAIKIVGLAKQHADPVFPKAEDILAVVGIESSFDSSKKSSLKTDPAVGLMQVRPKIWGLSKHELISIDNQIKHGVNILSLYYNKLGNKDAALNAYNVGLTNHRRGKLNLNYTDKFHKEQDTISQMPARSLSGNMK